MKILLVDDTPRHRRAGKRQLEALGHEVVTTSEYTEARNLADNDEFDIALLDLLMPAEATTLGTEACVEHLGREIAIGFPLAMSLAGKVKRIAVATDTNHHNHPMSAVVDWFGYGEKPLVINGTTVLIIHARLVEGQDGVKVKNMVLVLQSLLAIE